MFRKQFTDVQDAWSLAQAIVDTVREPLLVLDENLRLVAANQSFYLTFKVKCENTQAKLVYELGDGQWDIPKLRLLLEKIIPEHGIVENYEVEHDFLTVGRRGSLPFPTTATANLMGSSPNRKPDLVQALSRLWQSSLMLKWS